MKRAFIFNTVCIRRTLDCTHIYNYLIQNGWAFTNSVSAADLIVISTCGVIKKNEELALTAIKNITKKKNNGAKVIITGCLPKINPDSIKEIGDYEMIPTRELDRFDTVLGSSIKFEDVPDPNTVAEEFIDYLLAYRLFRNNYSDSFKIYTRLSTNKAFIKSVVWGGETINLINSKLGLANRVKIEPYYHIRIAKGCAFACSYCAVKFSTGNIVSKPIDEILKEFRAGLSAGHKVFQLVCEDTGSYGLDIGTTFPVLLKKILETDGEYQIVIIDFGGYWLVKHYNELLPLIKNHPNKIRELYVSLQSGSNKILKAMRRPEKSEDVLARLKSLKKSVPNLILRTTIIIGFPGETEEDFKETVEAIEAVDFSEVQIDKYEDRPGTISSQMADKVSQEEIDRRYTEIKKMIRYRTRPKKPDVVI